MNVSITPEQMAQLRKNAERFLKQYHAEVNAEVEAAAAHTRELAVKNLDRNKTNNEGTLRNSIQIHPDPNTYSATVATNTGYGFDVEFGRKPGSSPDFKKLSRWVRLKLKVSDKDVGWVTSRIQKKIFKNGTRPQPFMNPAKETARARFKKRMKNLIKAKR